LALKSLIFTHSVAGDENITKAFYVALQTAVCVVKPVCFSRQNKNIFNVDEF
jgi:hypothetical protein